MVTSEQMKQIWAERKKDPEKWREWKLKHIARGFEGPIPKHVKRKFPPSTELSYILGVLWGDAFTCNSRQHILGLSAKDKEFVDTFEKTVQKVINPTTRRYYYSTGGFKPTKLHHMHCCSKPFVEWYNDLTPKQTEEYVRNIGKKGIVLFIRGFFDADGSVICKRYNVRQKRVRRGKEKVYNETKMHRLIRISNTVKAKLEITQALLKTLKITSNINVEHRNKYTIFRLKIHRAKSQCKFADLVGSTIPRKMRILQQIKEWNLAHKNYWRY